MNAVQKSVRQHWYGMLVACLCCLLVGTGLALVVGRTAPQLFWIIYGGNTDSGDGNGGGQARDQMIAGGWTDAAHSYQVQWKADIGSGTDTEVPEAVASGRQAVNAHCGGGNGNRCVYAGFSLGTMPALGLSAATGHSADLTYLFGGPQPSPGIWHSAYQDNPGVQPWLGLFGKLDPNQVVAPGTHNYFDTRDPYNNAAPQCTGPGLFALSLDGHRIITRGEADASHQWTGADGVLEFESNYAGPQGLPASGSDPSLPWAGCEGNDWHNTVNSPGPQVNPDQPVPDNPVPGGSPIPSQEGNLPIPTP